MNHAGKLIYSKQEQKQIRKRGRRCQIEYRGWVFTGWLISSFQLFSLYCSVLRGLSLSFLMLFRRAQDLHSLSAMATGQFICGCNSIIMAIKLLEYMGDTVGLSSLQMIISQKADNWGSIGSVKTVIGEMGHWGTAVGTALWRRENGKGSRSLTVRWSGCSYLVDWRCHTSTANGKAVGGVSPSFLRELTKNISVRWLVVMTLSLTCDVDGSATLTYVSRSLWETMLL